MSGIKHQVVKLIKKGNQDKAASLASTTIKGDTVPIKKATDIQRIRHGSKDEAIKTAKTL